MIIIEDTGIGIPPDQQNAIFNAFTQTEGQSNRKYGGTGLGLAITKRLTTMLGGTIHLESEVSQGSRFIFKFPNLPVVFPLDSSFNSSVDIQLNQFVPLTILVVDDVKSNRDLIEGYFIETHHQVMIAEDGEQGIQKALLYQPDVILMDLRMPNCDGMEATKYLKQHPKTEKIPIIIVTASTRPEEEEELTTICQGFINKPVSQTDLVNVLQHLFPLQKIDPCQICQSLTTPIENNKISPALLDELQVEKETVWPDLCQLMKTKDIRQFSQRMQQLGQTYGCHLVLDYGSSLSQYLQAFDDENLLQTLEKFPKLIQKLENKKCMVE